MTVSTTPLDAVPEVSGRQDDEFGHLQELRTDPIGLLQRIRDECGDVGRFRLAGRDVVLVSGADVNEAFFRAPDEVLDQAEAYPFMTPIFGKGVVFDASPERRKEMLRNQALRGEQMRGHAGTIEHEVRRMVAGWGDSGEIDLLDFFAELTIYTTSSCLIGHRFREQLDHRFAGHYHDLERGTDALAYVDAYADIETFRKRDQARLALVALVQEIMDRRSAEGPVSREDRDLLDVLLSEDFPQPEQFDPGRYLDPRQEDLTNRWTWIPFGAGRHRCVGNAFAMMQLKAIFSVLLRDYDFEMAQPSDTYRDDCSKMVIQLEQPCRVGYRRRSVRSVRSVR